MIDMLQDGVKVQCLPDCAQCRADEKKRSPLNLDTCPMGQETCCGDCFYYDEV